MMIVLSQKEAKKKQFRCEILGFQNFGRSPLPRSHQYLCHVMRSTIIQLELERRSLIAQRWSLGKFVSQLVFGNTIPVDDLLFKTHSTTTAAVELMSRQMIMALMMSDQSRVVD